MSAKKHFYLSDRFLELSSPFMPDAKFIELRNGMYEGEIHQGKRSGRGIFIWDDSSAYVGQWENDEPHGCGVMLLSNGASIFGGFENGLINGKNLICFANGNRLLSSWRENELKGLAFFFDQNSAEWTMCEYQSGILTRIIANEIQSSPNAPCIPSTDIPLPSFPEFTRRDAMYFDIDDMLARIAHDSPPFQVKKEPLQYDLTIMQCCSHPKQGERMISYLNIGEDQSYLGFTKNFIPEGLGMTFQNGILKNIGNFKGALLSGLGRVYSEDGLIFDGEFNSGSLNGAGFLYCCESNDLYEGVFSSNACSSLVKKVEGFSISSIMTYREARHKHSVDFVNQFQQLHSMTAFGASESPSEVATSPINIFNRFQQESNRFLSQKMHNRFYYPNQIINSELYSIRQKGNNHRNSYHFINNKFVYSSPSKESIKLSESPNNPFQLQTNLKRNTETPTAIASFDKKSAASTRMSQGRETPKSSASPRPWMDENKIQITSISSYKQPSKRISFSNQKYSTPNPQNDLMKTKSSQQKSPEGQLSAFQPSRQEFMQDGSKVNIFQGIDVNSLRKSFSPDSQKNTDRSSKEQSNNQGLPYDKRARVQTWNEQIRVGQKNRTPSITSIGSKLRHKQLSPSPDSMNHSLTYLKRPKSKNLIYEQNQIQFQRTKSPLQLAYEYKKATGFQDVSSNNNNNNNSSNKKKYVNHTQEYDTPKNIIQVHVRLPSCFFNG